MPMDAHQRIARLIVAADHARNQSDMVTAERLLADALDLARHAQDEHCQLSALRSLGQTRLFAGDEAGAAEAAQEALEVARRIGDRQGEAWALQHLAWSLFSRGDMVRAKGQLDQSAAVFAEIGDRGGYAWAQGLLAWVTFAAGDLVKAETLARQVLAGAGPGPTGDAWATSMMRTLIANCRLWSGAPGEALVEAQAAADVMAVLDDVWGTIQSRLVLGRAQLALGDVDDGRATLEGAVSLSERLSKQHSGAMAGSVFTVALALQIGDGEAALRVAPGLDEVAQAFGTELEVAIAVAKLQVGDVAGACRAVAPMLGWEAGGPDDIPALAPPLGPWVALILAAGERRDEARTVLDRMPTEPPGSAVDAAWAAIARLALADDPQARTDAALRALDEAHRSGHPLAVHNVELATAALTEPAIPHQGWGRMWELVAASASPTGQQNEPS
jgi:tetratricopeptide (TPR) repeat protein